LVAISAVQFQTGLRMPAVAISELCHAHGAELFVDAIQACGASPIDVEVQGIDYLVTGGHKWLLGFEGAGFLYVRTGAAKKLLPLTASWLSHEEPLGFLFGGAGLLRYDRPLRARADVFETGSSSLLGLAALGATVPRLCELGPGRICEHVNHYIDALETGLIARGFRSLRSADPERRSTLFCVQPPPNVMLPELQRKLLMRGVAVGTPDGNLRFSPHFANALSEVPHVLGAVDEALSAG
jgi:selenocysteine lyase/cysteine desulfurase